MNLDCQNGYQSATFVYLAKKKVPGDAAKERQGCAKLVLSHGCCENVKRVLWLP